MILSTRRTVASEGSRKTAKALMVAAVAAASVTALGTTARADTYVNTGSSANLLNTAAAWNDITAVHAGPPGIADIAQWSNASGIATDTTFTLGLLAAPSWSQIVVSDVGANVTVSNDSNSLGLITGIDMSSVSNAHNNFSFLDTIVLNAANQTFNVAANRTLTTGAVTLNATTLTFAGAGNIFATGAITNGSGAGSVIQNSTGTVVLSGTNTYTGSYTLNSGTVDINNNAAFGGATSAIKISGGTIDNTNASNATTTLATQTQSWTANFTYGGTLALNLGTGTVTMSNSITLTTLGNTTLTEGGIITQVAASNLSFTKTGPGTMVMNSTNAYSGNTTVDQGLLVQNTNQNTIATAQGSFIVMTGNGTFATNNDNVLLENLSFQGGTLRFNNYTSAHNFTGLSNIALGAANGTASVLGNVTTGIISNTTTGVIYNGPGSLTLGGNNTFSGQTVVNAGTLIQNLPNNNSNITINAGGVFGIPNDAALGTETITWNTGTLQFDNYTTTKNFANITNLALGAANGTPSNFNGNITGTQGLVYNGPGSLILTNAQLYSGPTTVNQGVLVQSFADNNSSIVLNAPGALAIFNDAAVGTETITFNGGSLQFNNYVSNLTFNNAGLVTLGANVGGFSTLAGNITGNTSLTFSGPGTLSLTGSNNYTGPTTLQGGALIFTGFSGIGTGTAINFTGGTLLYAPGNTTDITTRTVTVSNTTVGNGGRIDINGNNIAFNNTISGNGSLSVIDSASLTSSHTLSINANMTYTGTTGVSNGATLRLNAAGGAPLQGNGTLTMAGGNLLLDIGSSFANVTQSFTATAFNAGLSQLTFNHTGVGVPTIGLGALTWTQGGILNIPVGPATIGAGGPVSATAVITTTTGTASSILVTPGNGGSAGQAAYVTVGQYDFAAKDPTNSFIVGGSSLPGFWTFWAANPSQQTLAGNADIGAEIVNPSPAAPTGVSSHNTDNPNVIRFNQNAESILSLTSIVATGAIMVTPNMGPNKAIINGTALDLQSIRGGNSTGIAFFQNDVLGALDIQTGISEGRVATTSVTNSGPGLVLMATSSFGGQVFLQNGVFEIASDAGLGTPATAANLNLMGGALLANATFALDNGAGNGTNARPIVLTGGGGTLAALTNQVLTVSGIVSGNGGNLNIGLGQVVGTGAGTAITTAQFGNGTIILKGANTYTGNTNVLNGATLQLDSNAGTGFVIAGSGDGTSTGTVTGQASNLTNKVFINSGSLFFPGHAGIGNLTINSLTLGSNGLGGNLTGGSTIDFSLAKVSNVTSVSNQLSLAANGSMTINGTNFINLFASGGTSPNTNTGTFILANLNGASTSGSPASFVVADSIPNTTYAFSFTGGKLQVIVVNGNVQGVWAADASGTWSTAPADATNWTSSLVPGLAGSTATFPNALGATPVVVTLGNAEAAGNVIFGGTSNVTTPTNYTINGSGANNLTINLGLANNGSITAGGGTNTINANVTLAGLGVSIGVNNDTLANVTSVLAIGGNIGDNGQNANVAITGTGSVVLTGSNTYGGLTSVGAGATLQLGNGGTTGNASSGIINNNGTLIINRSDGTVGSPLLFNNVISAASSGGLTINGTGVIKLTQVNQFAGNLNINAGVVEVGAAGSGNTTSIGRGDPVSKVIIGAAGKLDLNGFSVFEGSTSGAGNIDNSSATPVRLTTGSANANDTISGTISNSGGGALSIFKVGSNVLILSGNNTFSGGVNDNAGFIRLNTNTAAGNATITNSGSTGFALQLAPGVTVANNYLINGNNASDDIDVPDANSSATFAGAFQIGGGAQLRIGTNNTTSTLILTGTTVLGGSPIVFLTKNNVTFAGNGSWTANGTGINIGRSAAADSLNLIMNDNSFISSAGITLGGLGSGGADDANTNVTLNGNSSLRAGNNNFNLNTGSTGGQVAGGTANVTLNLNGSSFVTGNRFTETGTNQGATVLNFNGGTIIATGGDSGSTHFFPDFSVAGTVASGHSVGTVTTILAGGLKINDGGFAITFDQPLQGALGDGGLTKSGTGTVILTGNNVYTGATNILAGTVFANNASGTATGTGDVNVSANASFGGAGTISGSINSGGANVTILPGFFGNVANLTLGTGVNNQNLNLASGDAMTINFVPDGSNNSKVHLPNGYVIVNGGSGGTIGYTLLQAGTNTPFDINGTYKIYGEDLGYLSSSETSSVLNPQTGATYAFAADGDGISYDVTISGGNNSSQWGNAAGGSWNPASNTNWTNSITPNAVGDVATFAGAISSNQTVNITTNQTVGNVYFNNNASTYTIASAGGNLILDNGVGGTSSTATSNITVQAGKQIISAPVSVNSQNLNLIVTNAADSLTLGNTISGAAGNVTYSGNGSLVLGGNNAFTGQLILAGNGNVALNGTEATATRLSITGNANVALSGSNAFTGISKGGTGTMTVSVANAYTGATNLTGGTTQLVGSGSLGAGNASLNVAGSTTLLDLNGVNLTVGSLTGSGSIDAGVAGLANTTVVTLTTGSDNTSTSQGNSSTGILKNTTGKLALVKVGTGTQTLAGTNTYTGGTTISGGTLSVGADVNLGAANGTIAFNGGTLFSNASGYSALPAARVVTWGAAGGGIGTGNNFTWDRATNTGGFTKTGSGLVTMTANYTTTSPTVIAAGTLQIGNATASSQTFITPSIVNSGTLNFNLLTNNITINSAISGSGGLSQSGTGTATINGNYTATGAVSIGTGNISFGATANTRQDTGVVLSMSSLSIGSASILDISNHDAIIGNSNLTTVNNEILSGFGIGSGAAITSSTALSNGNTFLVPLDATANGLTTWDNANVTQPNSIIIKYTYFGDANLDGAVDGNDFSVIAGAFGSTTLGIADIQDSWLAGDLNLDGVVDGNDFSVVAGAFGSTPLAAAASPAVTSSNVPEPASLFLLGLGSAGMLIKRKRRTMM